MPVLHQYDYIFAIGVIFASLDAFNIGANDVANSFATSVSSKSLTMKQACLAAGVCEFLGAVLVGARVADTIKNGIIPLGIFGGNAGLQMLTFACALTVSASWLMLATYMSWPVSTTYSIVSAVAGAGVALGGGDAVNWGWNGGKGMGAIFSGLGIAPAMSAGFAAILYCMVKFGVLMRKDPLPWALWTAPLVFYLVSAILSLSIIYKGAPSLGLTDMSVAGTAAAVNGTAAVVTALSLVFWLPFVWARVVKKDYTVRWYHFFMGPLLWKRATPTDTGDLTQKSHVPDYRLRKDGEDEIVPPVAGLEKSDPEKEVGSDANSSETGHPSPLNQQVEKADEHPIVGLWILPRNLWIILRYKVLGVLTHGTSVDIHAMQAGEAHTAHGQRMRKVYAQAAVFPNEVEHCYSFVQVLTACTASFAHGANDVSNAIGPFAVIYQVWRSGNPTSSRAPVPVWILVFGGAWIVIGLATYGYNIMAVLGNRLTYHSPSRGFCMELGAAITVVLASQYGIPVSTTMCITGATIGVGLCNGDFRAVNWRALAWIFSGWLLTIAVAGTLSGCLLGIIINAPRR